MCVCAVSGADGMGMEGFGCGVSEVVVIGNMLFVIENVFQ